MPLHAEKTLLTQQEAAKRLGISQPTVSQLLRSNLLQPATTSNNRNIYVTAESVIRYSRQHHNGGRPMRPDLAMGLLYTLDGKDADWLTRQQKHRVHACLSKTSPGGITWTVRHRAKTVRVYTFPPNLTKLREQAMDGGVTNEKVSLKFGIARKTDTLECYMSETMMRRLIDDWMVRETDVANVTVHVVSDVMYDRLKEREGIPLSACAVDLTESADPREHATGVEQLENMLEKWRSRS